MAIILLTLMLNSEIGSTISKIAHGICNYGRIHRITHVVDL